VKTDHKIPPVAKFPFEALLSGKESIPIIIGKDNVENPVIIDLAQAPYLLIAGTPGTGKTECFNTLIASLQIKFSPDELKLLLIDSKVTAFDQFERVPHLLMPPVNDPYKALSALNQIADEITLKTDKDDRFVTVKYAGFPYLGIWQEYGADTPFICVEPWCGLPDYEGLSRDILKKNDMFHIKPNEAKTVSYSIIFG
jgi:galactose mutarotase-like enzyme